MSLSFKSCITAALILSSSLFGTEYSFDVNAEALNHFPHKEGDELSSRISFLVSDSGKEVVWKEFNPVRPEFNSCFQQMFYWSERTGTVEIDIDNEMHKLGFKRMEQGRTKTAGYQFHFIKIDNHGNVFLSVNIKTAETPFSKPFSDLQKIGVWNKANGFKMLNIPNIDTVEQYKISKDRIFVSGSSMDQVETFAVIRPVGERWPWEPEAKVEEPVKGSSETTPWDTVPYGKHGSRLHILQQLLKKTKDTAEKKAILTMVEGEVANVFDLLQYDVKRAQVLIERAKRDGKRDVDAEQLLADSKKHIKALLGYFNTLPKSSKNKIDSIRLPSNEWFP